MIGLLVVLILSTCTGHFELTQHPNIDGGILRGNLSNYLSILRHSVSIYSSKKLLALNDEASQHCSMKYFKKNLTSTEYINEMYSNPSGSDWILQHGSEWIFRSMLETSYPFPSPSHSQLSSPYLFTHHSFLEPIFYFVPALSSFIADCAWSIEYWRHLSSDITMSLEWQRAEGVSFVITASHPYAEPSDNLHLATQVVRRAIFLSVDLDLRAKSKDVIIPYVTMEDPRFNDFPGSKDFSQSASLSRERDVLLFFAGSPLQKLRRSVIEKYRDIDDDVVVMSLCDRERHNVFLMRSRYCFMLRGDTSSSQRLFAFISAGCIPVIVSDLITLPFEALIDWSLFTLMLTESAVIQNPAGVLSLLRSIPKTVEDRMRQSLGEAKEYLMYNTTSPINPLSLTLVEILMKRIKYCRDRSAFRLGHSLVRPNVVCLRIARRLHFLNLNVSDLPFFD